MNNNVTIENYSKPIEIEGFRNQDGQYSFSLTPKKLVQKTNAIDLYAKARRYGRTYAHKDIALDSSVFKVILV